MEERAIVLLRRKLEALGYTDPLDIVSVPLVQKLVEDLVRTTDSCRSLKLQCAKQAEEVSTFNTKVRLCTKAPGSSFHGPSWRRWLRKHK